MIRRSHPFLCLFVFVFPLWAEEERPPTVITSHTLEMEGTEERNYFYFRENVEVRGNNLRISCDSLTVTARRSGDQSAAIGEIGPIESIVAVGSVEIHQAGRSAFAGKAEVDPVAGTVTLSENPRIVDDEVEVEGYQFVLKKGEKKFISVPDPNAPAEKPSRSVVRLGGLPDLGFNQEEDEIEPPVTEPVPEPSGTGKAGAEPPAGEAEPDE